MYNHSRHRPAPMSASKFGRQIDAQGNADSKYLNCLCVYVYIYIYLYKCIHYIYIYIYIYIHILYVFMYV